MSSRGARDVLVIGAGVGGLSLARTLAGAGPAPLVLERAGGVGGRCATRRVDGQPVDHGAAFLHGSDPDFLAEVDAVADATPIPGWPEAISGTGVPCRPEAFEPGQRRVAFREGVTRFAKHLARGLDVRLSCRVVRLCPAGDRPALVAELETGEPVVARTVALAMPVTQASRLTEPLAAQSPAVAAALPLLALVQMSACATLIARYEPSVAPPEWEARYPESHCSVQAIFHDSAKRGAGAPLTLVLQAGTSFSRAAEHTEPRRWAEQLLADAGAAAGAWVAEPRDVQIHLWRHARVQRPTELAAPLSIELENGARLALCGDGFDPAGGLEGAWRSGRALAESLGAAAAAGS